MLPSTKRASLRPAAALPSEAAVETCQVSVESSRKRLGSLRLASKGTLYASGIFWLAVSNRQTVHFLAIVQVLYALQMAVQHPLSLVLSSCSGQQAGALNWYHKRCCAAQVCIVCKQP